MDSKDANSNLIKIKSSDGQIFEIEERGLDRAKLFKELKEILNLKEELPFDVDSKNLKKIIEFLNYYIYEIPKAIPKPLPSSDLKQVLSEWDYNYIISLSIEEIVDLVNAANYMNINHLINLACSRLASEMTNCSMEEAREKFGIHADMTEEEMHEYDHYPLD